MQLAINHQCHGIHATYGVTDQETLSPIMPFIPRQRLQRSFSKEQKGTQISTYPKITKVEQSTELITVLKNFF